MTVLVQPPFGFVAGKYFAGSLEKPDFMAIDAYIREAVGHAVSLWQLGYPLFVPHLNTHHFEVKTGVGEPMYQAFDRRVLRQLCDFVFATPNWRNSSGGRKEVMLASRINKPVFESLADVEAWRTGEPYTTIKYHNLPPPKDDDLEDKMKIALIEAPYTPASREALSPELAQERCKVAESMAVRLWNGGIGCFTPQLNAGLHASGYALDPALYGLTKDLVLRRLADCVVLAGGWHSDPCCRDTIRLANELAKPVFLAPEDALAWVATGKTSGTITI